MDGNEYIYTNFDSETTEFSSGITSLPVELKEDEFLSYKYGETEYQLISNSDVDRYYCTGRCFCEESSRRMGMSLSKRTFYHLVAAISSVVAYTKAKEYFEEECKEKFSDDDESLLCDNTRVYAEYDCDKMEKWKKKARERTKWAAARKRKELEKEKKERKESGDRYYDCHGYCVPNNLLRSTERKEIAKNFGCEKLKLEKRIVLEWEEIEFYLFKWSDRKTYPEDQLCLDHAKYEFELLQLWDYCEEEGKTRSSSGSEFDACHGRLVDVRNHQDKYQRVTNPTIECVEIFPENRDHVPVHYPLRVPA